MYKHPPDGGLKTRIMASIQTLNRQISVKESCEEVCKAMVFQWIELTEVIWHYGEMPDRTYKEERKIRLNRDYIIEVQP